MGFGGSVAAANQAMKTNRAMLKKRKLSFVSSTDEKWVDSKRPTPEQLTKIRTRIREEEKLRRRKTILITIIALTCIVGGILMYNKLVI